jgi:Domain of unknown function (DUF4249)
MKYLNLIFAITILLLTSCEKDIDIDLPDADKKIIVEGAIEQNGPPFVILTKSIGFFAPTDVNTLQSLYVHNAVVTVSNGTNTVQLTELCTSQLPQSQLPAIADLIGVSLENLKLFNYCLYTTTDPTIYGEIGKTYQLLIQSEGTVLTSSTQIPPLVFMDSYWYKDQPGFDEYGYLWFNLNDPPQLGNAYRMFTKRKGKDSRFIPAHGSVFDDNFINGLDFDAFVFRGQEPNSLEIEDNNETSEYYQQGDTIIIKFCSIDQGHFQFWNSFEIAAFNNGNPFAAPATIKTNINGNGLGVWGGYGVTYDTLVAVD